MLSKIIARNFANAVSKLSNFRNTRLSSSDMDKAAGTSRIGLQGGPMSGYQHQEYNRLLRLAKS